VGDVLRQVFRHRLPAATELQAMPEKNENWICSHKYLNLIHEQSCWIINDGSVLPRFIAAIDKGIPFNLRRTHPMGGKGGPKGMIQSPLPEAHETGWQFQGLFSFQKHGTRPELSFHGP
jgi:hypothetical protein